VKLTQLPCSQCDPPCLRYRSQCYSLPSKPCSWTLPRLLCKDRVDASHPAIPHPARACGCEVMLDADTTDFIIAIARIIEGGPVGSHRSNIEGIFLEFKLHEIIFCLRVPELMASYFVLFVFLVAFEGVKLCLSSKPYGTTIVVELSLRREVDDQIGHGVCNFRCFCCRVVMTRRRRR